MQRLEVTYRPEAISDQQEIFRFVAESSQNEIVASRFVVRIMARCRKIGDVPLGGRPRDDLAPDYAQCRLSTPPSLPIA